jgi:hypothetical protein
VVLSYWHKTKCHSSLDSALHNIAWYDLESLATKKNIVPRIGNGAPTREKSARYTNDRLGPYSDVSDDGRVAENRAGIDSINILFGRKTFRTRTFFAQKTSRTKKFSGKKFSVKKNLEKNFSERKLFGQIYTQKTDLNYSESILWTIIFCKVFYSVRSLLRP